MATDLPQKEHFETTSTSSCPIRVILIDDHTCVRQDLAKIIARNKKINLVAHSGDGYTAVQLVCAHLPDVVLMDLYLPTKNDGLTTAQEISFKIPSTKILGFSSSSNADDINDMLSAGASGYIVKNCSIMEVIGAILAVASGGNYFCKAASKALAENRDKSREKTGFINLTIREREIFKELASGKDTGDISSIYHISEDTVASHRRNILKKLNLKNIPELIWYAIRNDIIRG